MIEADLLDLLDQTLKPLGATPEPGEAFETPRLEVLRYYPRRVQLGPIPFFGRGTGVVIVVRQPVELEGDRAGLSALLGRAAMALNGRHPPWRSWAVGMAAVILTAEPITPHDDALLKKAMPLTLPPRRVLLTGLFRVNLGQEAVAYAVASGRESPFGEAENLADALSRRLRRFVPLIEV